jgi:hypothetical protein
MRGRLRHQQTDAPVLQESPPEPVVVCEYDAWHGFMIEVLYPNAARVSVAPCDPASRILRAIPPSARGVIMHLNASVTRGFVDSEDELRTGLVGRGQRVLNLAAVDVRKSAVHGAYATLGLRSARAEREGPPAERLIVKTTLNYGGGPERAMQERWRDRAAPFTAAVSGAVRGHLDYRVATRTELAESVWSDPSLVVERFVENPEGLFFRVYIAGPAAVVSTVWTDGEIKKLSTGIRRRHNYFSWMLGTGETIAIGPASTHAERTLAATRQIAGVLGLDFLGGDCVMDAQGQVFVVDVNKTPYWGEPRQSPILAHLRHGFNAMIGDFT